MINWSRVSELREEIGAEDFDDVVDLFLDEVETEIEVLRVGCDPSTLESRLHFLKGSALNLGFHDFSALCQKGETDAAQGALVRFDMSATIAKFEESRTVFLAGLDRIRGA